MRHRWLLGGTVALTTSLALIAGLPGSAGAVGEPPDVAAVGVAKARAEALAKDMAQLDKLARAQAARAQAAKARIEETTTVRVATFNVRTARADRGTSRHWLRRAGSVAREIKSRNPGVVLLQELGPGRADGKKAKIGSADRQTDSLVKTLKSIGAGKYKLIRSTAYVRPGTNHGTQGVRILYDSAKYQLISTCRETTGSSNYNSDCAIKLPILGSDSESERRRAAYALLKHRSTGQRFYVASVHLDDRHGGSSSEKKYDQLRVSQMSTVYNKLVSLNSKRYPMIIGGDINSWPRKRVGTHAPHNYLVGKGFKNGTAAPDRIDVRYPTINHFKRTLSPRSSGVGVHLDVVMAKGAKSITHFENVMKVVDSNRPSDHNMVLADFKL